MADLVLIPIIAAIVNGIAHAIDHRFRRLPVTSDQILGVLG
jgi:CO/xanthine dehydrogenase Mo-binding subunit